MSTLRGIDVIRRWVIQTRLKEQSKQGGVMITLPKKEFVDLNTSITADRLLRSGIDIDQLTSVAQVENLINRINKLSTRVISQDDPRFKGIMEGLMGKKGEVVDMTGKKIPPGSKIMGGKAVDDDLPPPGSRGGEDDIAAPVQSAEESTTNLTDSTIQNMLKMEPIEAMKEANKVIKREGIYKALDEKQAKKILEDTEDHIFERDFKTPDDPDFDPEEMAKGGRVGLFAGAVASGEDISPGTDKKGNVRDDNPFTGGGGNDNNNNKPPKKTLTTTQTKDDTKKNVLKTIGGFAFNRFLNSMGVPTKDIQKALAIKGILEQAGGVMFPEGDLQNIKAKAPDQKTYNIEATKDMVENLPGGVVKDIVAPAGALVMSPFYDTFQGIQRGLADPSKSVLQAIKDENVLSSALERFTGAAAPLAERFEKGGIARIGLKDGMNRRNFLKILGGALSIPIVGRFFKPVKTGKTVTKTPVIATGDVAGKPEWFDSLVNRVIMEGDDVTKRFATKDREIVHTKKIDDNNEVTVYQDLDEGTIRVDYDSPFNMGEDTVSLQYKPGRMDESTGKKPKDEFEASELEPRYVGGPEDADIEFDGLGGGSSIKMLESDVSKLKEYATGQKPTLKEFVESKKRKDRVKAINEDTMEQAEYISGKYGDGPEPDFDDIEDFARGGIARMLGE